jgi:hypothetical protein
VAAEAAAKDMKEEEKITDVFDNESNPPPDMPKGMSEPII